MANNSQCLDDLPFGGRWPAAPPDQYNEAHRLGVEELMSGGPEAMRDFLKRERLPSFLSEPEVGEILGCASVIPCGDDENSMSASVDCSSVTYFPDRSDLEPPILELGWPAFSTGSYRGVTRVDVHFQPSFENTIYICKEAARELIKSAREHMRVRTLTGNNYYTRSGTKIVGKVREKFLLVDGVKVATGNYSFTWTDGKLNSSNMLVLSGQVVEKFDLQFRVLYAQSNPISAKLLTAIRSRAVCLDKLPYKMPPSKKPTISSLLRMDLAKLSSTPKKQLDESSAKYRNAIALDKAAEEEWLQNCDIISGLKETQNVEVQTEPWEGENRIKGVDVGVQTSVAAASAATQTSVFTRIASTQTIMVSRSITTQTTEPAQSTTQAPAPASTVARLSNASNYSSSSFSSASTTSTGSNCSMKSSDFSVTAFYQPEYTLGNCLKKLTKERQFHYSTIRSKLNNMVSILSNRNRVPNSYMTNDALCYGLQRRDVMHSSLLNLRDGVRFYPNM
ncbi:protein FAM83D-B-like isoform X2 [Xenopus laevis]|uniref:Protein FAM83D-B-like isoform X2 n=1 Tax=Xenopus laevis TaxID=8355 RepID=A0A8J1LZV1_XENLA|nr:protein FAM83D-B-like isoform X2 [Xenopus laevis]